MTSRIARFERFVQENRLYFMLAVFVAALAVRLFYGFAVAGMNYGVRGTWFAGTDPQLYQKAAGEMLRFEYSSFHRSPLFPLLIAVVRTIFGPDAMHLRIVLAIIGSLSCVVFFRVGELVFNLRVAIFASVAAVFYLPLVMLNHSIMTETLYILLAFTALLYVFKAMRHRRTLDCILGGACMALAALTRAEFLFITALMLPALYFWKRREGAKRAVLIMVAAILLIITPWSGFASLANGTLVPISTVGGPTFLGANNPEILKAPFNKKGDWYIPRKTGLLSEQDLNAAKRMGSGERGSFYYRKSLRWLAENPDRVPQLLFWKQFSFWFSPVQQIATFAKRPTPRNVMIFYAIQYFIILLLFIMGFYRTFSLEKHLPLLVYLVGQIALGMIFYGDWRTTCLLQPVYLLFAGALFFAPRLRPKRKPQMPKDVPLEMV